MDWITEKNFVNCYPQLNLVKEEKDFTKILVIPCYPNFYENFLNLNLSFSELFKQPRQYYENIKYDLAIKYNLIKCDYHNLQKYMTDSKNKFFTEDEFLLLRNLLIKNCINEEYDEVVTISSKELNFEHLKFLKFKKINKKGIYGR